MHPSTDLTVQSIAVRDFLGIHSVQIQPRQRVVLFAGPNAAGKSSMRDALALALTGELQRGVALKKDSASLINGNAKQAEVAITMIDGTAYTASVTQAGKLTTKPHASPVLLYTLQAQRFGAMSADDRRRFLLASAGITLTPGTLTQRLTDRGIDADAIAALRPHFNKGTDAAATEAKALARDRKAQWNQVTGETWGSVKGAGWVAPAATPVSTAMDAKAIASTLANLAKERDELQAERGAAQAAIDQRVSLRDALHAATERAGTLQRVEAKLTFDRDELTKAQQKLQKAQTAAGTAPRSGLIHELAFAVNDMLATAEKLPDDVRDDAERALTRYETEHGVIPSGDMPQRDEVAAAEVPRLTAAVTTMERAVAASQRDVDAAKAAAAQVQALEQQIAELGTGTSGTLTGLDQQIADIDKQANVLKAQQLAHEQFARLDSQRDEKTAAAKVLHDAIVAFEGLGDALSPSGVPADLIGEALAPVNARLALTAESTDWAQVHIAPDMSITAGDRQRHLLSESEQWRTDAAIAEAFAHLWGGGLLMLDRCDVLDPNERGALLGWLDTVADLGELSTVICFATLKAPIDPAALGLPHIDAYWVADGAVIQPKNVPQAQAVAA